MLSKTRAKDIRHMTNKAPRSLVDAVEQNWEIVEQLSSWRFKGGNSRDGFFRLRKKIPPKRSWFATEPCTTSASRTSLRTIDHEDI